MKKFKFLDAVYYSIAARSVSQADAKRNAKAQCLVQAHAARAYVVLQKIRAFRKGARLEQTQRDCTAVPSVVRWSVKGNPISMQKRHIFISDKFRQAFFSKLPSFHDIKVSFSHDINFPSVSVYKTSLGRYSSRCAYNKIKYNFNIVLPKNYLYDKPRIIEHSGQTFWYVSKKLVKNCLAYKCLAMNKSDFSPRYVYVVERNGATYIGKTLRDAMKRALNSVTLTFKSFISRSMYATITGACGTGITQFCEKHNITKRRIKVSELLEIMDGTEYGYQKFIGVITND